ncbi:anti-sigma factor antagonist [Mycobacterium genavense]|uniref:anti-sigma factor antagonist n=1 Tax=Mycobacterium genavense TaxID=36812 RepID=UPI00046E9D43|nr:anti-sigma factor antagonist [Mycobacterium genavense]
MKTIADHAPPMAGPRQTLHTRLVHQLSDPHSTLRATTDRRGAAVLIYAGGEIDACNEQTWRGLVSEAAGVAASPGSLIVDVTGVDFIACCAVEVLAEEAAALRRRGVELRLVSPQRIVARIVDACGLGGVLPIYPTVDAALAR